MGEEVMGSSNGYNNIERAVGFIGAGNMAKAIAFPLFQKGVLNPTNVMVSATSQNNLPQWEKFNCATTTKNEDVFLKSDVIFWAVKPQMFPGVISSLQKNLELQSVGCSTEKSVVHISVMAGLTLSHFQQQMEGLMQVTSGSSRCFRVMPNIGLKVSCGVAVYCGPPEITHEENVLMENLFKPNGLVYSVAESQLNAYCGLFGSGIGFMFPIIEALSDGAVKMGIPRNISLEIAAQVMKGAGALILQEKLHPGVMKDAVCSPGGTTIAGVAALEDGGVRSAIIKAVEAATVRGEILGGSARK